MKSGMMISTGSYRTDLTEATDEELQAWIDLMDEKAKDRTISYLVSLLRRLPSE